METLNAHSAAGGLANMIPDDEAGDAVRPIRALLRGLEALRALNERDGLTVTEVADKARLPRTTAYRILETLCQGGFVVRDEMDDRYRPTLRVRGLADGAQSEAWIHEGAWPILSKLGKSILWPVGLWTQDGPSAVLRAATDRTSPLALVRHQAGERQPLATSSIGHLLMAFLPDSHLDAIGVLNEPKAPSESRLAGLRAERRLLDTQVVDGEICLAVPVLRADGALAAAVSVRFIRSAITDSRAMAELLPAIENAAREISVAIAQFDTPQASAGSSGKRL